MHPSIAIAVTALAIAPTAAAAQTGVEDFESGNPDAWEIWFGVYNSVPATGGNLGAYLELDNFNTGPASCDFIEIFPDRSSTGALQSGNWRTVGVDTVSIDMDIQEGLYMGDMILLLVSDPGTPNDSTDDCIVTLNTPGVGATGPGWKTYTFSVPSTQTTAPPGWEIDFGLPCSGSGIDAAWNTVIQDVDRVEFIYDGDPLTFCAFTSWVAGVDNITVSGSGATLGTNYCMANPNSTGTTAVMSGIGSQVAAMNDVTLTCGSMPTNAFGFFITSMTQGFIMNPAGSDGNLCLSGAIGRYVGPGQVQASGALGEISLTLDLMQHPTPTGFVTVQAGQTWNFSAWFRDGNSTGPTSNFGDGYSIVFN